MLFREYFFRDQELSSSGKNRICNSMVVGAPLVAQTTRVQFRVGVGDWDRGSVRAHFSKTRLLGHPTKASSMSTNRHASVVPDVTRRQMQFKIPPAVPRRTRAILLDGQSGSARWGRPDQSLRVVSASKSGLASAWRVEAT